MMKSQNAKNSGFPEAGLKNEYKDNKSKEAKRGFLLLLRVAFPSVLLGLFYFLKSDSLLMQKILINFVAPLRSFLARITSTVPLPLGEILFVFFLGFFFFYVIKGAVLFHKDPSNRLLFLKRVFTVLSLMLWLWAGFSWLWNIGYYVPGFAETNHLVRGEITSEDLEATTIYFAGLTNRYAGEIRRDENGIFAEDTDTYFQESVYIYDNLAQTFPALNYESYMPKRLIFSKLQSNMGFTGFYCPYTGEANINIDAPSCLQPVTIAHEIAHQRLVTCEDEANFVAIAACIACDDATYLYSGALMGLMKLGAALNARDPQSWAQITKTLEPNVIADWNHNAEYWSIIKTPLEEVSRDVYDSFLKSNNQELGIDSYGACVDLLVSYYSAAAKENP